MAAPKLMVKRARPVDAAGIAELVATATNGRIRPTEDDVLDRLGARGFYVAHAGALVGLVGWTAENLVARVEEFVVHPVDLRATAGRELLNAVEDAARELECEAALLLISRSVSPAAMSFYASCGYAYRNPADLPEAWAESASEILSDDNAVLVKQLRSDLVRQPI